jgi:hypothetical protein
MHQVRFESTIPVSERAKTVPAVDRAATAIGSKENIKRVKLYVGLTKNYSMKAYGGVDV